MSFAPERNIFPELAAKGVRRRQRASSFSPAPGRWAWRRERDSKPNGILFTLTAPVGKLVPTVSWASMVTENTGIQTT